MNSKSLLICFLLEPRSMAEPGKEHFNFNLLVCDQWFDIYNKTYWNYNGFVKNKILGKWSKPTLAIIVEEWKKASMWKFGICIQSLMWMQLVSGIEDFFLGISSLFPWPLLRTFQNWAEQFL